jgi:hypothetical protein
VSDYDVNVSALALGVIKTPLHGIWTRRRKQAAREGSTQRCPALPAAGSGVAGSWTCGLGPRFV